MVSKLKREELAKKFQELSRFAWWESIEHDDLERALILVDEIIKVGWVPIEDFPDEELPEPAQAVVNDVMDRIISGLPTRVLTPANPDGVHVNDMVSKYYPKEFISDWHRIPDFDNYEINTAGEVRSRWTKRKLEVSTDGDEEYVDMHDKDGFGHIVNVRYVREKVFGE